MTSDPVAKAAARTWTAILVLAFLSVILGGLLGFASQALLPVKTYAVLPTPDPAKPDAAKLPKVYWLKQYTSKSMGAARDKEKAIKAGLPAELNDREMSQWLNRVFGSGEEVKEDLDAKLGTPFIRIGGQRAGGESDPVLTVTMPFKLKILNFPVSDVPLQFTAKPKYDGEQTEWDISGVHVGHARVPSGMASRLVARAAAEIMTTKDESKALWRRLGAYQRIVIRDNRLFLEAPDKLADEPAPSPVKVPVRK